MSYRTENDNWREHKRIFPSKTELIANQDFYKYKRQKYRGKSIVYDMNIRTGECQFCRKSDKKGETSRTILHHLKYDDSKPLAWTVEACPSCHYKVDKKNKNKIDRHYAKKKSFSKSYTKRYGL